MAAHMITTNLFSFFLVFMAISSAFKAQENKQCEYEMIVSTGPTRGPTYKLGLVLEAVGGKNINTTNMVKHWGDMGLKHTYFLPNSTDRFRTRLPCMVANFCWIGIKGKKGELNPHWFINSVTVSTKGDGINRFKTFLTNTDVDFIYPYVSDGECP
ncbi:hypothetical protein BVC80_9011g3 [Macleaya cordata]|uniref:PLAT/LH2 domain n=1 Tax=Macleaya cordata TaxID=56857 RepID=A0A200QPV8_MACCD|nr:hypothetical protein BVC80_9011g3 [Macleaya cordata]